jgi:hypothetical protein
VKSKSRCKQLQRYKGNWATIEIMRTLIKNRRTYKHRIGSMDDEQNTVKNEVDYDGNDGGSDRNTDMDSMYVEDKKDLDSDEDNNGEDGGDKGDNGMEIRKGDYEDGNGAEIDDGDDGGDGGDGNNSGDGGEDKERSHGKAINGSRGWPGGKDSGESTKRKLKVTQDDEQGARAKRSKKDGSGGDQGATQSTKKAMPKRKAGKKRL